jgi:hypothetical protein
MLSIARLWEARGLDGFDRRTRALTSWYQVERTRLSADDDTTDVVRRLMYWMVWVYGRHDRRRASAVRAGQAWAGVLVWKSASVLKRAAS